MWLRYHSVADTALRRTYREALGAIVVAANRDAGALYGAFRLLRLVPTNRTLAHLAHLATAAGPKVKLRRVLGHWDNLDRTAERGYAGRSLWTWDSLPGAIPPRYRDSARQRVVRH